MPDSTSILVAGQDGTSVVDIATGQATSRIEGAFAPARLSPDGHTLAATLDAATAVSIGLFEWPRASVRPPSTPVTPSGSPDSPSAPMARPGVRSDDHMVLLWDVATGERRTVLRGHAAPVKGLAFSPDGTTLASGGEDQVLLWDLYRAETLDHQLPPGDAPAPLAFPVVYTEANPDGTQVIFTDFLRVQIRDVATGALSEPIDVSATNRSPSSSPVQGPGRWYVTVTPQSGAEPRKQPVILRIWDRKTENRVAEGLTAEPTEEVFFTRSAHARWPTPRDQIPRRGRGRHQLPPRRARRHYAPARRWRAAGAGRYRPLHGVHPGCPYGGRGADPSRHGRASGGPRRRPRRAPHRAHRHSRKS